MDFGFYKQAAYVGRPILFISALAAVGRETQACRMVRALGMALAVVAGQLIRAGGLVLVLSLILTAVGIAIRAINWRQKLQMTKCHRTGCCNAQPCGLGGGFRQAYNAHIELGARAGRWMTPPAKATERLRRLLAKKDSVRSQNPGGSSVPWSCSYVAIHLLRLRSLL